MTTIDVQGSKLFVIPVPSTPFADCTEAVTALKAGAEVICPLTLGEMSRTRPITELGCISSDETLKVAGKLSYGDFTTEMLLDETDVAGQKVLYDAMNDNTPIIIGIESPDMDDTLGTTDGNGTVVWTECLVSGDTISYPDGSKVGYSVTLSPFNGFNRCSSVASTS